MQPVEKRCFPGDSGGIAKRAKVSEQRLACACSVHGAPTRARGHPSPPGTAPPAHPGTAPSPPRRAPGAAPQPTPGRGAPSRAPQPTRHAPPTAPSPPGRGAPATRRGAPHPARRPPARRPAHPGAAPPAHPARRPPTPRRPQHPARPQPSPAHPARRPSHPAAPTSPPPGGAPSPPGRVHEGTRAVILFPNAQALVRGPCILCGRQVARARLERERGLLTERPPLRPSAPPHLAATPPPGRRSGLHFLSSNPMFSEMRLDFAGSGTHGAAVFRLRRLMNPPKRERQRERQTPTRARGLQRLRGGGASLMTSRERPFLLCRNKNCYSRESSARPGTSVKVEIRLRQKRRLTERARKRLGRRNRPKWRRTFPNLRWRPPSALAGPGGRPQHQRARVPAASASVGPKASRQPSRGAEEGGLARSRSAVNVCFWGTFEARW
ncbi:hypothetical protein C7M84_007252 [Penaeus vannamei]|uniref:Uncharacterized protein n=1 Tax=Penaeus vannamei TaxID=6689 RepID=A0A3R7N0W2_PENVA|nr:hypothetical protein C7M84_007252 [Penaeus vannamei]